MNTYIPPKGDHSFATFEKRVATKYSDLIKNWTPLKNWVVHSVSETMASKDEKFISLVVKGERVTPNFPTGFPFSMEFTFENKCVNSMVTISFLYCNTTITLQKNSNWDKQSNLNTTLNLLLSAMTNFITKTV